MGATQKKKLFRNVSIADIYIIGYIILVFFNLLFPLIVNNAVVLAYGFLLFATQLKYILKQFLPIFLIVSFSLLVAILFSYLNGVPPVKPLYLIPHLALFCILIRYNINRSYIRILLYSYIGFISFNVIVFGIDPSVIFLESSRNMVGWFGLALCLLYYSYSIVKGSKIEMLSVILTLFLMLLLGGRSSIVVSFVLLLLVFFIYIRPKKSILKFGILILIPLFSIWLYSRYQAFFDEGLYRLENKRFESDERELLFFSYIEQLNFETFIMGVSSNSYPFYLWNNNFHNSFLLGHSIFGVFFLFFLCYLFYLMVVRPKSLIVVKFLILVLLLRSVTDTIMFVGFFDFILLYLLYFLYKNNRSSYKINQQRH